HSEGLATVGEMAMFVNFATMLIGRLEQVVSFVNSIFMEAPRLKQFFEVLGTVPAVRDRPDAIDSGRLTGLVEFNDVTFSYDGRRPARRPSISSRPAIRNSRPMPASADGCCREASASASQLRGHCSRIRQS